MKYLAENKNYKVYAIEENVYLKDKRIAKNLDNFESTDTWITWHYGNPTGALIIPPSPHIIVVGCGISIYNVLTQEEKHILANPDSITWTNAIHQDKIEDNSASTFRFIAYDNDNTPSIFKMDIHDLEKIKII